MQQKLLVFGIKITERKIVYLQLNQLQCNQQFFQFCRDHDISSSKARKIKNKIQKIVNDYSLKLQEQQKVSEEQSNHIYQQYEENQTLSQYLPFDLNYQNHVIFQPDLHQFQLNKNGHQKQQKFKKQERSISIYVPETNEIPNQNQGKSLQPFLSQLQSSHQQQRQYQKLPIPKKLDKKINQSKKQLNQIRSKQVQINLNNYIQQPKRSSKKQKYIQAQLSYQKKLEEINKKELIKKVMKYEEEKQDKVENNYKKLILLKDHVFQQSPSIIKTQKINRYQKKLITSTKSKQKSKSKSPIFNQSDVFERLYQVKKKNQSPASQNSIVQVSPPKSINRVHMKSKDISQFYTTKRSQNSNTFCVSKREILKSEQNERFRIQQEKKIRQRLKQQVNIKKQTSADSCKRHECNFWKKSKQKQMKEYEQNLNSRQKRTKKIEKVNRVPKQQKKNIIINADLEKTYKNFEQKNKVYRF